jgi:hypothetical protein
MDSRAQLDHLAASGQTVSQFFLLVLNDKTFENHPANDILGQSEQILDAFFFHPKTSLSTSTWAHGVSKKKYVQSIQSLSQKSSGWHFNAFRVSAKQLEEFQIKSMAECMQECAPELWDLVGSMLGGVSMQKTSSKATESSRRDGVGGEVDMDLEEREYSAHGHADKPKLDSEDSFAMKPRSQRIPAERRASLIKIVCTPLAPLKETLFMINM